MTDDKQPAAGFNRQPLVLLASGFAVGILAARFLTFPYPAVLASLAVFALVAIVLNKHLIATVLVCAAFVAAGIVSYGIELRQNDRPERVRTIYDSGLIASGEPVEVEGVLTATPEPAVDGYFVTLRSERLSYRGIDRLASGNVRIFVPGPIHRTSDLKYGSRIRVACSLEREDKYLNPGVIARRELLDRLGVDATCSVKSSLLMEHIADESVFLPLAWVYEQRGRLIESFRENLSPNAAGVMIASLLGNKHFLDKRTADLFREGGTFHILVISGLHITFIGGLVYWLLRRVTRRRTIQFVMTNSILWAYTLAVGADVPAVRAAIMFTIMSFSYVIYRQSSLLNSLGLCALILLVWRPSDLFNSSFQLTFVSVAAITACAYPLLTRLRGIGEWTPSASTPFPPRVPNWLQRFCETLYWQDPAWKIESGRNIWSANLFKSPYVPGRFSEGLQIAARYLFEGLVVSLVVQLWMLPITVVYFHRVSIISIVLNLWVGFFIALESFAAVAGALAERVSTFLATGFFAVADGFNWFMLALPRLFADNGWLSYRLPAYGGNGQAVYFLYFVPILILTVALTRWRPFDLKRPSRLITPNSLAVTGISLIVLIAFVVHAPFAMPRADGRLRVDFLDVGQGDAVFITFPNGQTMLVDGGGSFDYRDDESEGERFEPDVRGVGESVVSEFLWDRGYSRVDHILATHAHADHIGGLIDVARNFTIGSAIVGPGPGTDDPELASLAEILRQRDIPVETVSRGDVLKFGDACVEVLYPTPNLTSITANDSSIVLRIVYGDRAILLTGDIEQPAENELVGGSVFRADVVKVPHHGSRTSSTPRFVEAAGAQYAIISAPRRSPFGHPHRDVVERWRNAGATVRTTGENGMISISTDGKALYLATFTQ